MENRVKSGNPLPAGIGPCEAIPSQASPGTTMVGLEGVETQVGEPNDNPTHERPARHIADVMM